MEVGKGEVFDTWWCLESATYRRCWLKQLLPEYRLGYNTTRHRYMNRVPSSYLRIFNKLLALLDLIIMGLQVSRTYFLFGRSRMPNIRTRTLQRTRTYVFLAQRRRDNPFACHAISLASRSFRPWRSKLWLSRRSPQSQPQFQFLGQYSNSIRESCGSDNS